jgi:hypothetical protein
LKNVYSFSFYGKSHGNTLLPANIPYFIGKSKDELVKLYELYRGKVINRYSLLLSTMGIVVFVENIWHMSVKKICKMLKIQ